MNPVQKLTVSASASLDPDGETLRVTGSGYDAAKAVHVALCKDNGDNRVPSPCLGGADENGTGSSSQWIVPEGDEYAGDLAVHWGAGGTFDVRIDVKAKDSSLDCTKVACSVVTRVDHRNPGDRSQDVKVPVGFVGQDPVDTDDGNGGTAGPAAPVRARRAAPPAGPAARTPPPARADPAAPAPPPRAAASPPPVSRCSPWPRSRQRCRPRAGRRTAGVVPSADQVVAGGAGVLHPPPPVTPYGPPPATSTAARSGCRRDRTPW
ncbi:hypothetical protein J7F01_04040 [Streptomyces sp. ISL-22]|uniref:hypothetical protein n=1 Tax=unclassified Streptomyces TaxID=2593676 RepID=UPI001BE560C1|nr:MULTISPECIES: hypothetical protein [unclassified Streptomyces]MBT2418761.1 hypothetical protein [Streptomyces sp. ISL-24]MBT2431386.1 hypothetical protein [Streptomyces sp. ISL-22]